MRSPCYALRLLIVVPFLFNFIYLIKIFLFDKYVVNSLSGKRKKFFSGIQKRLDSIREYGEINSILEDYFVERSGTGRSELTGTVIENHLR